MNTYYVIGVLVVSKFEYLGIVWEFQGDDKKELFRSFNYMKSALLAYEDAYDHYINKIEG